MWSCVSEEEVEGDEEDFRVDFVRDIGREEEKKGWNLRYDDDYESCH